MYKGIIFDLDGTLLDTIEDLANACNYALTSLNFSTHKLHKYNTFIGDGRYKLIERILPKDKRDYETINHALKLFDEYYLDHMIDKTKPYSGIDSLLKELKLKEYKIAVVSNKPHEFTKEVVSKFFENKIEIVIGHRKDTPTKPDPYSVNEVIEAFNLDKKECVYIGDSNVDIKTAKNTGITSIGVGWGFRGSKELKDEGANYIVESVNELRELLIK